MIRKSKSRLCAVLLLSGFGAFSVARPAISGEAREDIAGIGLTPAEQAWLAEHPVIRVHNEMNWAPFNFNKKGVPTGYSIDYMNLLAQRIGVRVEYVSGPSWDEFLEMMKAGQLDVMLNIVSTEERREYILFTDEYLRTLIGIYASAGSPRISSLKEFSGKTLSFPKGFSEEEMLHAYYPDIKQHLVRDNLGALEAVLLGKADAALGEPAVMSYLMHEYNLVGLELTGWVGDKRFDQLLRLGVRKDWPLLRDILQKAKDSVSIEEKRNLQKKWEVKPIVRVQLTEEEKAFIAKHPVVKVGNENDWEPFDFAVNGEALGYSIDHLRLIGEKVGLKFDFVNGFTWNELMAMLKNGELDILPVLAETPERLKFMRFTSHYMVNPTVLVVGESRSDLHSVEDLLGMRVAVVGGYYYQESIEREYPEIKIVPVRDFLSGLEAVIHGNAEAFIGSQIVVTHTIRKHFLGGLRIAGRSGIDDVDKFKLRIGVRTDQQTLLGLLEKGMRAITREERQELANRWIGLIKEEDATKEEAKLTKEEHAWLERHPEIRLGIDPAWPPFEFMKLGQDYSGIAADFVHILNKKLGIAMKPVPGLSWAEVMEKTKAGEIDVLPCVAKTPERSEYLNFTIPYLSKPLVILSREDSPYFEGVGDVQGSIAVIDGYFSVELLKRDYPDKNYLVVPTMEEAIKSVERGDANVFIGNLSSISYTLQKLGFRNLKVSGYTEYTSDLHFAIRKDWPELVEILNKQLAAIPEAEKRQIISSWINYRVEKEIDWMLLARWILGVAVVAGGIVSFFIYTNRKLAHEVSERKKAEEAADAANQAKSDFLANMSHEIRTPMSAVLGFSEILKNRETDPKKLRYIEMIYSSGHALLDLINDILDLSKVEAGKLELQYSSVDVGQMLADLNLIFEKKIVDKGLEFIVDSDPDLPGALLIDQVRIRQILINLIGNAIKFTDEGHIRVVARAQPEGANLVTLLLEVEDTGIGIPANQQQTIFSKFEQVKGQKVSRYGGTGLGLAISYQLAQIMGGQLSVNSEEGKGSTFRVALHGIEVAAAKPGDATEQLDVASISFEPATILIADDIDHNREIISSFLSGLNLEFVFAANGKETIEQARKHRPNLILLDMKMPVMDGYEAADLLHHDKALKNIPLIAVSASALKEDEALISKLCDGYLRKPLGRQELICELMKYLAYSPVSETPVDAEKETSPATAPRARNPEKLSRLLQQLEGEACRQWDNREQLSIREIGAFAETLVRLGEQFDDPPLTDWSTQLQQAVEAFDIEKVNQQMSGFPKIVQELKDDLSRQTR